MMQINKYDIVMMIKGDNKFGRVGEVIGVVSTSCLVYWYDNGEVALVKQGDLKNISDRLVPAKRYNELSDRASNYFGEMVEVTAALNKYKKTKFTLKELKMLMKAKKKGKLNKILERK